jgi:hypothetical protein
MLAREHNTNAAQVSTERDAARAFAGGRPPLEFLFASE